MTEIAVLNSQVVPVSQVVLKTGFTVLSVYRFLYKLIKCVFLLYETAPKAISSEDKNRRFIWSGLKRKRKSNCKGC